MMSPPRHFRKYQREIEGKDTIKSLWGSDLRAVRKLSFQSAVLETDVLALSPQRQSLPWGPCVLGAGQ